MIIVATVPVRRHLKQFLTTTHAIDQDGVLDLTEGGVVPFFLSHLLTTKTIAYEEATDVTEDEYTDQIKVKINTRRVKNGRCYFPDTAVKMIDRFIHRLFHDMMYQYTQAKLAHVKCDEKDAILEFLQRCGISEDDYSFDAAKKAQYRRKSSR